MIWKSLLDSYRKIVITVSIYFECSESHSLQFLQASCQRQQPSRYLQQLTFFSSLDELWFKSFAATINSLRMPKHSTMFREKKENAYSKWGVVLLNRFSAFYMKVKVFQNHDQFQLLLIPRVLDVYYFPPRFLPNLGKTILSILTIFPKANGSDNMKIIIIISVIVAKKRTFNSDEK